MAVRKRKKAKKTKSKVARRRKSARKAAPRKKAVRRRRKSRPAASPKKAMPARAKSRKRRARRPGARQAARYVVAVLLGSSKSVKFFGGVVKRRPVFTGMVGPLQFGSLPAAKDIARQLIRMRGVRRVGVYRLPVPINQLLADFSAARKSPKRKKR